MGFAYWSKVGFKPGTLHLFYPYVREVEQITTRNYGYTDVTEVWTAFPEAPAVVTPRFNASASTYDLKAYIFGGGQPTGGSGAAPGVRSNLNTEWSGGAQGVYTSKQTLTAANMRLSSTTLATTILLSGGQTTGADEVVDCYLYNPGTNSITATGSMATARRHHGSFYTGVAAYATGGASGVSPITYLSSTEKYDTGGGTWSGVAALAGNRAGFGCVYAGSDGYAISGYSANWRSNVEKFDTGTETWAALAATANILTRQLANAPCGVLNGKIHMPGAEYKDFKNDYGNGLQVFDVSTETWSYKTTMPFRMAGHSTAVI